MKEENIKKYKKYSYGKKNIDNGWSKSKSYDLSDYSYDYKKNLIYDKYDIRYYLSKAKYYQKKIREISLYLYNNSTHYLRFIKYFTNILTLDFVVIPQIKNKNIIKTTEKVTKFIEKYNIKHEFKKIINILLLEDIFFGYEIHKNNQIDILRLPTDYCKITGIKDGIFIFEFNFSFFDDEDNFILLQSLPKELQNKYYIYKQNSDKIWQELNYNYSICFKLMEELDYYLPFFSSLFEEIIDLQEKKDIADIKEKLDNYKLIVQTIPLKKDAKNEKDIIFSSNFTQKIHENVKKAVPKEIGVVTTPMKIESISLQTKKNSDSPNSSNAPDKLINASGFGNLFGIDTKSEIAFKLINKSDESIMFTLLKQFERFFNNRLNNKFNQNVKILFPEISIFNREEKLEEYLKLAQFGYPKTLVSVASGINQNDLMNLTYLENTLDIIEDLKPLKSTHTQVGENNEKGGRPKKEDEENINI